MTAIELLRWTCGGVWILLAVGLAGAADRGRPWVRHTIDASSRGADGVRLADVNADGRPDIVTGWEEGGQVRIYLHPGPQGVARPWPAVTVGKVASPEDAVFADLDGDGAADVVSSCEGRTQTVFVHWAPPKAGDLLKPSAWQTRAIPATRGVARWMFCLPMQVDGQRGIDLVVGSKQPGGQIAWLESPADPRDLAAWKRHPICQAGWIMSLIDADMDGDGDVDVIASDRKGALRSCFWLENPGRGEALRKPWPRHVIGAAGKEVMFVWRGDVNGDGRADILAATKPDELICMLQTHPAGKAWRSVTVKKPITNAGTLKSVAAGEVDLDGKIDVVLSCENASREKSGVLWVSFPAGITAPPGKVHEISGPVGVKYDLVELLDVDGDGDLDVLTCEERANLGVIWYENPARARAGRSAAKKESFRLSPRSLDK